jgi:2-dehydropantoate 2-reductase
MRHAILGAGGIGGLVGAALARTGGDVVLLMRPESLARYDGRLAVESAVLGDFEVDVPAASALDRDVDTLWMTTKATQLEPSLALAPPERIGDAVVIPLLNGVDHVALLRARYRNVVAGAIRVESERLAPSRIRQSGPFLRVELAGAEPVAAELRASGRGARDRPRRGRAGRRGGTACGPGGGTRHDAKLDAEGRCRRASAGARLDRRTDPARRSAPRNPGPEHRRARSPRRRSD